MRIHHEGTKGQNRKEWGRTRFRESREVTAGCVTKDAKTKRRCGADPCIGPYLQYRRVDTLNNYDL